MAGAIEVLVGKWEDWTESFFAQGYEGHGSQNEQNFGGDVAALLPGRGVQANLRPQSKAHAG